jgi:hypothetical protein
MSKQLAFTVYMYQSSTRKNLLDILLDPTAIAILGSIALHATIAATLPFFTQPDKAGINGPTTVKVVELTPNELLRIPQAPPTPAPQVLPPVTQPTTPSPQATPPSTPEFSTAPQTIPFPSIVGTPQPKKAPPKPKSATKQQKATPQKQPNAPIFDPELIFKPTPKPKPNKSPIPKGVVTPKPVVRNTPKQQPITKKTQPQTSSAPQKTPTDNDGGQQQKPTTPATTPTRQSQQPTGTPKPSGTPTAQPPITPPATQPSGDPSGNASGFYGKYTQAANAKLQEYLRKYPTIKQYPPKQLSQQYPPGIPCSKVKQPPFIVLMVAFDKVPEGQENNILGSGTSPLLENEKPYINGDPATLANKKLLEIATTAGFADATDADKQRPVADKGKPVLYTYRVQFDPATCKN